MAAGALAAGLVTVLIGAILIFKKRAGDRSNSTFQFAGINLSSGTVGGLFILASLVWGCIAVFLAPKVKIDGDDVALILKGKDGLSTVASLKSQVIPKTEDIAAMTSEFHRLATTKYAMQGSAGTDPQRVVTSVSVQGDHPIFSMSVKGENKSVDVKYVPLKKNDALEFEPIEMSVRDHTLPNMTLMFSCRDSIQAFLRKKREQPSRSDLDTHRKVLLDRCQSEISALSFADKTLFQ